MSSARKRWKMFLALPASRCSASRRYNYVSCYCGLPIRLTLSGGNVCPLRSEMAKRICSEVRNEGIELCRREGHKFRDDLRPTSIPIASTWDWCSAASRPTRIKNVRQVATLGVEPLHLLVRPEKVKNGRRVARRASRAARLLGGRRHQRPTSRPICVRFAGLQPATANGTGDFEATYTREAETIAQLKTWKRAAAPVRAVLAERLPDAFFVVDSLPSPLVDELVKTAGYQFVPLPYATALHLNNRRDDAHLEGGLESNRIEAVTIPAFTYGIAPASPPQDCQTFGLRLLLIAHKDVPHTAVVRLLRALDKGLAQRYHVDLDAVGVTSEFPIHPGAAAFAKDRRPLSLSQMLEPLTNFLSVIGAGAAGGLALWGFLRADGRSPGRPPATDRSDRAAALGQRA